MTQIINRNPSLWKTIGMIAFIVTHTVGIMTYLNNRFSQTDIEITKLQCQTIEMKKTIDDHSVALNKNIEIYSELKSAIIELRVVIQNLKEQNNGRK